MAVYITCGAMTVSVCAADGKIEPAARSNMMIERLSIAAIEAADFISDVK